MSVRIYTLAKEIGEEFDLDVKSSELADEIRQIPEFSHIQDSIKSHASTIDEDVADRVKEIYAQRHGKSVAKPRAAATDLAPSEEPEMTIEQRREEEARRRREVEERRRALAQRKASEMQGRMEMRQGGVMRPSPLPAAAPQRAMPAGIPVPKPRVGQLPPLGRKPVLPGGRPGQVPPPPPPPQAKAPAAPGQAAPIQPQQPAQPQPQQPPQPQAPRARVEGMPAPAAPQPPRQPGPQARGPQAPGPGRPGFRNDGQPMPPPKPKLREGSVFRPAPPPPPVEDESEEARDRRRRERDRRKDEAERDRDRVRRPPGARRGPAAPEELVIPDLEALSGPSGKGRRAGKGRRKDSGAPVEAEVARGSKFRPSKVYGLADEFKRPAGRKPPARGAGKQSQTRQQRKSAAPRPRGPVHIGATMTLGELAARLDVPAAELVKKLLLMGQPLTVNQMVDPDLAELIASDYDVEVVVEAESDETDVEAYRAKPDEAGMKPRPPVVTIMGHVDHGKTTLLDAYRESNVVGGEAGAITQHIGAYHVETPRGEVVFLDTPGHAAFTAMRARGAKVTDIVILVVAADDGVMPQTIEAINHAKEAEVPIIVAINKMDLPGANPQRVRNELMQYGIVAEELGGDAIFVELSAKQKTNLDGLLEMVLLQSEVMELKADPSVNAEGIIIESHVDPLRGAVATVLVQQGTLEVGNVFVVGTESGRVRTMIDDRGHKVKKATPSHPVEIAGLSGSPEAGELFLTLDEERIAREIAGRRDHRRRVHEISARGPSHVSLENLHDMVAEGRLKELKVVLKADVQGSLEAVAQSLEKLSNAEVTLRILHKATGGITENDVTLANASDAVVVGFNVRPDPAASQLADHEGIEIKTYRIIYELIDEFQKAIIGMLAKRFKEVQTARVEIREIFKVSRLGNIAGCMVLDGEIGRNDRVRLIRDGSVIYEGKLSSLRRMKDDAAKVASGYECGLTLENFQDIKQGDIVEGFKMEEIPVEQYAGSMSAS